MHDIIGEKLINQVRDFFGFVAIGLDDSQPKPFS